VSECERERERERERESHLHRTHGRGIRTSDGHERQGPFSAGSSPLVLQGRTSAHRSPVHQHVVAAMDAIPNVGILPTLGLGAAVAAAESEPESESAEQDSEMDPGRRRQVYSKLTQ